MNAAGLSFEQAPPFSVPLRFFLTAPLFIVLAAALILWEGPGIFASRWLPATLALTHMLVLGFMAQVMLGALLQILPVAVGVTVARPRLTAALIHIPLTVGTLGLAGSFLLGLPLGLIHAGGLLGLGFGVALLAFYRALWQAPVANVTVIALRCALIALAVTVVLGLLLAGNLAWGWGMPVVAITDLHALWGLVGWTTLLLTGVAFQVIPMFYMTPPCPAAPTRGFVLAMIGVLAAASVCTLMDWSGAATGAGMVLATGLGLLAITILLLLGRRRRKISDPVLGYWYISLLSLLAGSVLWLLSRWIPALTTSPKLEWLLGVLLIFGFAVTVINGMLYKIVPFLAWFHLQAQLLGRTKVPNIKQLLPDRPVQQQGWAVLAALLLLLGAVLWPDLLAWPAALALGGNGIWLGVNLLQVARAYHRCLYSGTNLAKG